MLSHSLHLVRKKKIGCFLACDVDDLAALRDPSVSVDLAALRDAVRYVEEWQVADWVAAQNRSAGVAVSTASVLAQFRRGQAALDPSVRPAAWGTTARSATRTRIMRWRRRYGGRYTALKPREYIPKAEMWTKARDTILTNILPQQPYTYLRKRRNAWRI